MRKVLCIPAGRRRFLRCLIPYVLRERGTFDECRLWVNNWESEEDLAYIRGLPNLAPDFFRIVDDGKTQTTGHFSHYGRYYEGCHDPDTIYVKCDDDIVWVHPGSFARLIEARLRLTDPLLICGNIVNNTYCNTLQDPLVGYTDAGWGAIAKDPHDPHGHTDPYFASFVHERLLNNIGGSWVDTMYNFGGHWVNDYAHAPNHVFAWYGRDTAWSDNDEQYVTTVLARELGRPIYYHGPSIFAHWAYTPQHSKMPPELLARYARLAEDVGNG